MSATATPTVNKTFPVAPGNIAWHLVDMARRHPQQIAVHCPMGRKNGIQTYQSLTYDQLNTLSDQYAYDLLARGIQPGMRTVLLVTPGIEFFGLVFALFKVRAVMVCVDPGIGARNIGKCLKEAEPGAFIGIRKAQIARRLLGWGKKTIHISITIRSGDRPEGRTVQLDHDQYLQDTVRDEMAAILFTSGSTGVPKGVIYHQKHFIAQIEALKHQYGISPGEVDLCTFPLFALFAPALGMTAVIPEMNFTKPGFVNPADIFEPIEKFNVTNLFGSPALLDRISRAGVQDDGLVLTKLNTLKRVNSAGAPVPWQVLERMTRMLPENAQVFTPYGATESLPVCSIGSDEILNETSEMTAQGKGVCVGKPVDSITLKIIPITDEPISSWDHVQPLTTGEIGEIVVKGPQVTPAYFNRDRSNKVAKILNSEGGQSEGGQSEDVEGETFWHRMGDVGYLDETGRVWFCGRKSHRVVLPEQTLFTDICEGIFNQHKRVYRSALVGISKDGITVPVIWIELEKGLKLKTSELTSLKAELLALAKQYEFTKPIRELLFHPGFPVDIRHNAKIGREKLGKLAQKKLS